MGVRRIFNAITLFPIKSCRGNIILSLDDTNAAKHLLSNVSQSNLSDGTRVSKIDGQRELYLKVWNKGDLEVCV